MTPSPDALESRYDPALTVRVVESWPLPGVRAGSGLAWHGASLVAVQDDAYAAVRIDPATRKTTPIVVEGHGGALPKKQKPDFEAIATDSRGRLVIFGSGSSDGRRRIARLDLASGTVTIFEAGALYDAVADAIGGKPNVEGAVIQGDGLRLFHRGNGRGVGLSLTVKVPYALEGVVSGPVSGVCRYDLGAAGEVPFAFTDAVALDAERVLYLAVAEDTPNAIDDGPIVGASLGVLGATGGRWAPILEPDGRPSVRKFEGVALSPDHRSGYLITDADDPDLPAELVKVTIEGL